MHSTGTSYVLYAYLYCIYALVGGAISICDQYICAIHDVCVNESHSCLPKVRCLCNKNVAIGFKTGIVAYFVERKNGAKMPELLEVSKLRHNF